MDKRKSLARTGVEPRTVQPVTSRCTDYATTVLVSKYAREVVGHRTVCRTTPYTFSGSLKWDVSM